MNFRLIIMLIKCAPPPYFNFMLMTGIGVAMGNAHEDVKALASKISFLKGCEEGSCNYICN